VHQVRVSPLFDYCSVFADLTGRQKFKLKQLMNACVRFTYNLHGHVSHHYNTLSWLFANNRFYLTCCLLFSIIRSGTSSIASNLRPCSPCDRTCTSPFDLVVPPGHLHISINISFFICTTMWNLLPVISRKSESLNSFKRELFRHLRQ